MKNLSYFRYAIGLSVLIMAGIFYVDRSFPLLGTVLVLAMMELAVSFDNAIVNASVMERMTPFWRQMFITVGIFIAVIGMRFYLPIEIVSTLGGLSYKDATSLAFSDPGKFSEILTSSHLIVAGFGGAFLMMIFLKFFIDAEREEHWIPYVEFGLHKLGHIEEIQILITATFAGTVGYIIGSTSFFIAAISGIIAHIAVDLVKAALESIDGYFTKKTSTAASAATGGFGMLLYLEIFDASMSFDGVIAAFAISKDILVVAGGLGIGAVFVRSMTLLFYDTKSLATYKYLEPGAFWAIGGLSVFMFLSAIEHIPDWVISGYGGLVIAIAFIHSIIENRKDAAEVGIGLSDAEQERLDRSKEVSTNGLSRAT